MDKTKNQRVVCAAYKMEDGLIVTGIRHYSPEMRAIMERIYGEGYHLKVDRNFHNGGFVDQYGTYLTREEAWVIAERNRQIIKDHDKCIGTLYSEHIY